MGWAVGIRDSGPKDQGVTGPARSASMVQELMQQTKEHEDALMRLMIERNELSCEYAKMPAHGGRTLADRRRKVIRYRSHG
jgi:hypothetical protein